MRKKRSRFIPLSLLGGMALATTLTGCPGPAQILQANLANPAPRVGESTIVRVEILAQWFRTPSIFYRARRGRIIGLNGEMAVPGTFVRASNQVRYFAPFTSSYPSAEGLQQNDVIEIYVQDGTFQNQLTVPVIVMGSTVVFSMPQNGKPNGTLMMAIDMGNGQSLSPPVALKDLQGRDIEGVSPVISPDGQRIAYVFYPGDGTSKIMMRDAAGQVMALTNNARGLNIDPAWSPDGKQLLFAGNHETGDGTFDLYLMVVDQSQGGRAVTRLTNNNWDDRHPAWNPVLTAAPTASFAAASRKNNLQSPGGRAQNWNLYLMDSVGNYTRALTSIQGDGDNWAIEPAWRLDGQAIAYTRFGPVNNLQSSASRFQRIFVQELQNASPTVTPLNPTNTNPNTRESSPIWSSGGTPTIYYLLNDINFQTTGRLYQTSYSPGNTFTLPQLVGQFQTLNFPLTIVGGTNRDITGYHPIDWR